MTALPVESYPPFDGIEFASIGTLLPTGWPHLAVSWIARDGDDVLISTVKGRRTHLNPVPPPLGDVTARYPHVAPPELNLGQLSTPLRAEYLRGARSGTKAQGVSLSSGEREIACLKEPAA